MTHSTCVLSNMVASNPWSYCAFKTQLMHLQHDFPTLIQIYIATVISDCGYHFRQRGPTTRFLPTGAHASPWFIFTLLAFPLLGFLSPTSVSKASSFFQASSSGTFPRPLLFLWEKQNKKSYSLGILQTNIWNPEILSLHQNSLHFNQILCLNFLTCKILAWIQILQICCKNWKFRVGAREIAWQLRALFVLSEEQGSIPTWWLNYL